MKRSEMNAHQKAIFDLMSYEMSNIIGGYENLMMDYTEDDEEYKEAKAYLSQSREELIEDIYNIVMDDCKKGSNATHARFAGGQFLRDRIEAKLIKWGY